MVDDDRSVSDVNSPTSLWDLGSQIQFELLTLESSYYLSMLRTSKLFIAAFIVSAVPLFAMGSTGTVSANALLEGASATARKEKKNVLVIFHASWCGWCKKLDAMLESPEFKATFEKSYVITHIDVMEQPAKKELENAGGADIMTKLGGEKAGLPFYAVLSPSGTKLADSILPKTGNIGFPAEPSEISGFRDMLKKTAPKMRPVEISRIEQFLKASKAGTAGGH